jgi:hypothetical protein
MMRAWGKVLALTLIGLAAPSLASAQRLGGASGFEPPLLRLALGLLLCTLVAIVAALAIRRFMHAGALNSMRGRLSLLGPTARKLRVIESHRISPHADVCMFTSGGREYLVVVSPGGATVLRDEAQAEEPAP